MTLLKTAQTLRARRATLPALLLACLALPAAATPPAAPPAESPGWRLLRQNHDGAARTAFQAALKQNPADAEASRGLGQVEQLENNEAAALRAWRPLYHIAPGQWAATAYWPQVTGLAQDTGRWDLLEGAARDILAAKDAPPALRASARLALAQSADRAGRMAEAARTWDVLGYVRRWQVIGPFDNASQSGFDKVYPPEREAALEKTYAGKDDQALRWHALALVGRDGRCAVGTSLGDGDEDVFFAVTAVQSPRDQAVLLQFDPTGASKVFVNGAAVLVDPIKRSHTALLADPFSIPVTLRAGWNTVLIKLSDDKELTGAFALRVTTAAGEALPALLADPKQAKGFGATSPTAPPTPPETAAVRALRRQPSGVEAAALLGANLRLAHDYQGSAEALRAGIAAAPGCGWLHWELAQTLEDDEQKDEGRAERDLALRQNPRLLGAALDAVLEAEDAVTPTELITRARAALALNPASPDALWLLSRAYGGAKLGGEALKAARLAVAAEPGTSARLRLIHMEDDQDKRPDAVAALALALRAAPADTALLDARAGMLSDQENDAAAIPIYQRLVALDPADPAYPVSLAERYRAVRRPAEAVRALRLARSQRPQNAGRVADLADLLQETGKTPEAVALYSEAIRLDPAQLTLRDKRAVLSGEKPVIDLAPATDGALVLAGAARVKDEGVSAVMLLDEGRTVVYPDFATLTRYHQILKVLDQAGARRYQSYPLARDTSTSEATVESARLLKADGKVQDVTDDAGSSVSFPSLAPGDVVDVTYRVEDFKRGGLSRQFWGEWSFNATDAPSRLSRYVLITPPGLAVQARAHGAVPAPSARDASGWHLQEWRMADVPARKSETLGTGFTDASTWLDLSTVSSWTQVVQWYQDLSRPRCLPDAAIRAKALELTKDAKTEQDKIHALQAFVAHEVQYQSSPFRLSAYVPTEGKQVLRERYGDCKDKAALLTALLGAVGIKSDMVLLSPRGHGLTPYLPSPRFNHAIARVQTASGPLWVDATADQLAFGALPPDDQQVSALVISDATEGLTLTPTLPAGQDRSADSYTGTLDEAGTLRGVLTWSLAGSEAWFMRAAWKEVPGSHRDETMRGMAGVLIKNAVFDGGGFDNLADPDPPLSLHFQYHVDHFSTPAGKFLLLPLPWNSEGEDKIAAALLADPLRTQDLELANARSDAHSVVRLAFPPGYVPQELPPDVHQQEAFGSFTLAYALKGGALEVTRDLALTALRLPAKDIGRYAAFLQAASQASGRPVVLKKP